MLQESRILLNFPYPTSYNSRAVTHYTWGDLRYLCMCYVHVQIEGVQLPSTVCMNKSTIRLCARPDEWEEVVCTRGKLFRTSQIWYAYI